ncbi:MAG: HNH endonuclease [Acidipropionibacterium sp.]|jgi:hypothetical protein|nr:HNH endonuclease [Acidipropionibacterium sp.]
MDAVSGFRTRLQAIREHLDGLDYTVLPRMSDAEIVDMMTEMRSLADRMSAGAAVVTDAVDKANATEHTTGTPLGDFLASAEGRTPSQGIGMVKRASKLTQNPKVKEAALSGDVSPDHATAIGEELGKLPQDQLSPEQVDRAAGLFLDRAATTPPGQLKRATKKILEEVAPEAAPSPDDEAARIAAQRSRAVKDRRLVWGSDGEGSTWFSGQLPDLEAQQLIGTLQAFGEKGRRAERDEAKALRDKRAEGHITDSQYLSARLELENREARSTAQRMADALVDMVGLLGSLDKVPSAGGQTPRLVVTLNYQGLHDALEEKLAAGVVHGATGEIPVDAGPLRRMCCGAGILPVVLGGESQVMDMGQERRLVTGAIRRALEVRDGGCIFPGCTVPADLCQAHHIRPWWNEGPTSLDNLCLVCRHHHALVEPDRYHSRDQWRIVVDPDTKIPLMLPPERLKKHLPQSPVDPAAGRTGTENLGEESPRTGRSGTDSLGEESARTGRSGAASLRVNSVRISGAVTGANSARTGTPNSGESSDQALLMG